MYKSGTPTEYRQRLRQRILKTATREFQSKGIKAVKMDDIANLLSVSKRTVYELYKNKEQLLMECVKEEHCGFDAYMATYASGANRHVIDIILEFYRLQMRHLAGISPVYFMELHKFPEIMAWKEGRHRETEAKAQLFFQRGIAEGYFKANVNYELISKVGNGAMNYVMENRLYKQYDFKEIFRDVIILFIRGFCTLEGIRELDRQIEEM